MTTKETYYKLSNEQASLFACTKTGLKVTQYHPGKTIEISKKMNAALRHGHIVKITKAEYDHMLENANNKVVKPIVKPVEDSDDERESLLERLKALDLNKTEFNKIAKKSDEEILEYLELNEEEEDLDEEEEDEDKE